MRLAPPIRQATSGRKEKSRAIDARLSRRSETGCGDFTRTYIIKEVPLSSKHALNAAVLATGIEPVRAFAQ